MDCSLPGFWSRHRISTGYYVNDLVGGNKPIDSMYEETFKAFNVRSQRYYQLKEDIIYGKVGGLIDTALIRELGSITYEITTEKTVRVHGKDVIRKVLGKSPDLADALCYCNWVREPRDGIGGMPVWGGY